ncbi:DJ-1/PfpI family protein [Vibrio parahaemolyticus]|nr:MULTISPECIES: DJ-1/PfpI family protein [Vibrio]EGQ9469012.1 DJ-1/PfpI family protein [Vibrio parahaemolyticus]EGR0767560.1 DJ-1/PfpI family protein [Vibrio parahaemolyticus]EGR0837094.1 DJ-1/PfpI family protein [Vibrio parahaemolyticus]EGR2744600.1 DJ-1/PfpI family protein [Vibrio parahaemolyticus]EGR2759523.1 DJ-1/PfpI family protein [Vibrio parahaemolyticus]
MENLSKNLNVGIYIYPGVTMLDAYAPLQVLAVSGLVNVFTFSKSIQPVSSDANVMLLPNYSVHDLPHVDVLIVPGSANPIEQIRDNEVIDFLTKIGSHAKYITSVCTGSLILAETGLLDGYKVTTHWAYKEALNKYPKLTYLNQRVVKDGNRISGGGITSGLDFSLELLAELSGDIKSVESLELLLEYDPQPPFGCGNHNDAKDEMKNSVQSLVKSIAYEMFN